MIDFSSTDEQKALRELAHDFTSDTLTPTADLTFPSIGSSERPPKPCTRGATEIRCPCDSVLGARYLTDAFDTLGEHVDALTHLGTTSVWGRGVTYYPGGARR